ncbi:TIGR04222 domain-containing membrane protein [Polymorphospora rubra]|uniref:TIGR04222 domain-containing membrane protein n=1 Tax=Polymorphospora rubra TaxID=338584 RepID=UPI0033CF70BE
MNVATKTWGLSGPEFLLIYCSLTVVLVMLAVLHRHHLLAGRGRVSANDLTAQQVAYLNGQARLAIYSALAVLRSADAVKVGPAPDRHLLTNGPPPAGSSPLDLAVYRAAGQRLGTRELAADGAVAAELTRLRGTLEQSGLLPTADVSRVMRGWLLALTGVLILGLVRLTWGIAGGKPVLYLAGVLISLSVAMVLLHRRWRRPRPTRSGEQTLAVLHGGYAHLQPANNPSWAVYGTAGAAMGVALFGPYALWAADPGFAGEASIARGLALARSGSLLPGPGSSPTHTGCSSGSWGGGSTAGASCGSGSASSSGGPASSGGGCGG